MRTLRNCLQVLAALAAIVVASLPAAAQKYPERPVRIIVPNQPGGVYDFVGRLLAAEMSKAFGQSFFVENRAGGGSVLGTQIAATAAPDGHTLLMGGLSNIAFNSGLYQKLPYDPIRDLVPVALVYSFPYILVARKDLPQSNLREIIAAARERPNSLSFGSPGVGSAPQILGAVMMKSAGISIVEVPYKGVQAPLTDLLAGRIDLVFGSESASMPLVRDGKVKAIVTAGARRSRTAPDLPTMQEAGMPGLAMDAWLGLFAPARTPPEIVARLREETIRSLPELRGRFAASGGEAMDLSAEQTAAFVKSEYERWSTAIRAAGIKAE